MLKRTIVSAVVLCALAAVLVAPRPAAGTDYNDNNPGDWSNTDTWLPTSDYPQSPADTAIIDTAAVELDVDLHTITSIDISGSGSLYVSTVQASGSPQTVTCGSLLKTRRDLNWDVTLNGGEYQAYGDVSLTGALNMSGDCLITQGQLDKYNAKFRQDITGTGTVTFQIAGGYDSRKGLWLTGDNSGHSGAFVINMLNCYIDSDKALGSATSGPSVTVNDGARLRIRGGGSGSAGAVTLDGGTLESYYSSPTYNGTVTLAAGKESILGNYAYHWTSRTFDVAGKVTGTGALKVATGGLHAHQFVKLSHANNDYSGGTDLSSFSDDTNSQASSKLIAAAAGCLGTGTVNVNKRTLETTADGALDNVPAVLVSHARLLLGSTETNTITLLPGGQLEVAGGSTELNYSPNPGNVQIHDGAILHKASIIDSGSVPTSRNQIHKDGAFGGQIYMGFNANPTGSFTVGYSANAADLYKGLACMDLSGANYGGITLGSGVTVTETVNGGGFALYAARSKTLTVNGASLNCTGQLALEGHGSFSFAGGAADLTNVGGIDMNGSGVVTIPGSLSGKTLNVNNGRASFAADALDDTSLVNVNGPAGELKGGGLYIDTIYTGCTGRIKLKGGGISVGSNDQASQAALDYVNPSYIAVRHGGTISIPDGNSLVVQQGGSSYSTITIDDLQLPDEGGAIMVRENSGGDYRMTWNGDITANGDTAYMAARNTTKVNAQLHMSGANLVIGGSYTLPGYYGNMTDYDLNARVELTNAANEIGTIEIREGATLYASDADYLGGPTRLHIAEGATFFGDWSQSLGGRHTMTGVTISGGGLFKNLRSGGHTWGTKLYESTLSPGDSAGILTFNTQVNFQATGTVLNTVHIEVFGDGAVGGTDHDLLVNEQNWDNLGNADLLVQLGVPSKDLTPANLAGGTLGDMVIMTAPTFDGVFNSGTTGETLGAPGSDTHWQVKSDGGGGLMDIFEVRVDADGTTDHGVLLGANLAWTARRGNANLDEIVDVLDLARLANNFGKDVANGDEVTWLTADFNLDGKVDVLDLAAIANNFGKTGSIAASGPGGPGGGAPVPEPGSAALLVLGLGAIVVRRRRAA